MPCGSLIQQDGVEIGLDEAVDKATAPTVTADLFVQLLEAP